MADRKNDELVAVKRTKYAVWDRLSIVNKISTKPQLLQKFDAEEYYSESACTRASLSLDHNNTHVFML